MSCVMPQKSDSKEQWNTGIKQGCSEAVQCSNSDVTECVPHSFVTRVSIALSGPFSISKHKGLRKCGPVSNCRTLSIPHNTGPWRICQYPHLINQTATSSLIHSATYLHSRLVSKQAKCISAGIYGKGDNCPHGISVGIEGSGVVHKFRRLSAAL